MSTPAPQRPRSHQTQPASPLTAPRHVEEDVEEAPPGEAGRLVRTFVPGWLVSLVTHLALLTLLGICYFDLSPETVTNLLAARTAEDVDVIEEFIHDPIPPPEIKPLPPVSPPTEKAEAAALIPQVDAGPPDVDAAPMQVDVSDIGEIAMLRDELGKILGTTTGSGFSGRGKGQREKLARELGSNPDGEHAVALALRWLALHQRPDGGWSFDHRHGPCKTNPGSLTTANNGATGLALLPFLGAGQTHTEGQYKPQVKAGLDYLIRNMKSKDGTAGDLSDAGTLYSHGICAIVLCEAYAMTGDKRLIAPAQAALNYIVYAQDPVGGGWRYQPRQPGDTSVVGWQLMALKSGHMAYLQVPPETIKRATQFLDAVQTDSGSAYGYTGPGNSQGTTSVGLLCRMYLGWKKDHGALERGVARLGQIGPSKNNLYYNYYATQVMRHYGGEEWKKWNSVMRDQMINSQAKAGAEQGSWYITGDHGSDRGGRLYCTSMATMILEVYYRPMPIYSSQATEEDFPL